MIERTLEEVAAGRTAPLYLVVGDLPLAEAAARRLGEELASRAGAQLHTYRRPERFSGLLDDLATFSLFGGGKVVLAIDAGLLADRRLAAELLAETEGVEPPEPGEPPGAAARSALVALLQALRLCGVDPHAGSEEEALAGLPDWALAGRAGRTSAKRSAQRRAELAPLLAVARASGLQGVGTEDVGRLVDVLDRGLPPAHHLVLAERSAVADHPLLRALEARSAVLRVGDLRATRDGWQGLERLAAELERETGAAISRDALEALAERCLKQLPGREEGADPESVGRFAAEYRKLALLSGGGRIGRELVTSTVEDRGDEDGFQILDAIAEQRPAEALTRLGRLLAGASDRIGARLSFFGLLASFCRQLVAVQGAVALSGAPTGERSYPRFKDRIAPRLTGELPEVAKNPLAGLHPFRLHRVYLAAGRLPATLVDGLPWRVLETELALKGESGDPDGALTALVLHLAAAQPTG